MKFIAKLLFFVVLISSLTAAQAVDKEPYTQERFDQLQAAGEVVLVDVFATWCPTCAKQQKSIAAYAEANPDKKFHVLVVDFDDDKDIVRKFRAPRQSTLMLYKGGEQLWFSVADARLEIISAEIDKAIAYQPKS